MHRLLRNVCLILCWLMAIPVSAQRIISGTVFDENKEPLMGATVSVKEKVTLGTTTDTQGKYTLKLPDNREYTLQGFQHNRFVKISTDIHPCRLPGSILG